MTGSEEDNTARVQALTQLAQFSNLSQQDPLNLSNSDSPGASLSTTLFDGSNFISWSKQVRLALGAKLKIGFINGTVEKPKEGSSDLARWERCDQMVTSWLLNSMTVELRNSFIFTTSAKDLWNEIAERYNQSTAPLVYQLKQELMRISQGDMSVTAYYNKLKRCWAEIDSVNGIPACSCGSLAKCTCNVMSRVSELEDQNKLMHFLINLNSSFDPVKSNILSQDPLPNLNRAYYMVMQFEKQKQLTNAVSEPAAFLAFPSENKGRGSGGSNYKGNESSKKDSKKAKGEDRRHCTHCNKDGHLAEGCFEIIGYPDWYKGKRVQSGSRMAAQVSKDTPLDEDGGESSGSKYANFDPEFVQALCQEMMRAFKGKVVMQGTSANFAGPFE